MATAYLNDNKTSNLQSVAVVVFASVKLNEKAVDDIIMVFLHC